MTQTDTFDLAQALQHLPEEMEVASIPGVVFSVIVEKQVVTTHAVGVKSTATREVVTTDTVFQAASLSKPVFAYAVLGLQGEGAIDLDRPLHHYLPIADTSHEPLLQTITARHVLSHTSGLQNWRFEPADQLQSAFLPGERFSYSGEGYFYLQRVIEQLTGQGIEAFMQERVLQPLGMHRSTYIWRAEHEDQIAMGHRNRGEPGEPWNSWQGRRMLELATQWQKPLPDWRYADVVEALPAIHPDLAPLPNNMIPNVAGSLLTTAPEFAQFMIRVLELTAVTLGSHSGQGLHTMMAPQTRLNSRLAWGLGWGLEDAHNQNYFWHWGENGLFENFAIGNPQQGSGIVILTNGNGGLKVCERIVWRVFGHAPAAFLWL